MLAILTLSRVIQLVWRKTQNYHDATSYNDSLKKGKTMVKLTLLILPFLELNVDFVLFLFLFF